MISPLKIASWIKNNLAQTEWEEGKKGGFVTTINGAAVQVSTGVLMLSARDPENPNRLLKDAIRARLPKKEIGAYKIREWFRTKILRKPPRVQNNEERIQEQLYKTIAEIVTYAAQQCVQRYSRSVHEQNQASNAIREKIFEQLTGGQEY